VRVALLLALLWSAPALAHEPAPETKPAASPSELPAPGSYELPPIQRVSDASVLDESGAPAPLLGLAPGQVAFVSFSYTRCADGGGCPLALAVLQRLDRRIAADSALRGRVRLATLSFDPTYDTPPVMQELRARMRPAADWRFLTGRNVDALAPVLADFGQDALPLVDDDGRELGVYRHILKVFLVDAAGAVRNVYSAGFLSADLLAVDARTVLLETERAADLTGIDPPRMAAGRHAGSRGAP
jgi:cytochrome oxidase Cu insertion factor (SCO1/SenC/PrrC family)